jgi:undecaprenyl-diphosphatase
MIMVNGYKTTVLDPFFLLLLYVNLFKNWNQTILYVFPFITLFLSLTKSLIYLKRFSAWALILIPLSEVVKTSGSYSFFSGHAANSMAVATFIYLVMKPHFKCLFLLFLWPLVFAYSRIYLGLH